MDRRVVINRIVFTVLALMCMALIFLLSSQNAHDSGALSDFIAHFFHIKGKGGDRASEKAIFLGLSLRKLGHISEFFVLEILVFQAVKAWGYKLKKGAWAIISFVICYLYACSDELHQCFSPNRGPSFTDTLIDSIGIVLALVISVLLFSRRSKQII